MKKYILLISALIFHSQLFVSTAKSQKDLMEAASQKDLMEAAKNNLPTDAIMALYHGADPNVPDQTGVTSFGWAIHNDDLTMIKLLLTYDPTDFNKDGKRIKAPTCKRKINFERKDPTGRTLLDWAKHYDNKAIINFLEEIKFQQSLSLLPELPLT